MSFYDYISPESDPRDCNQFFQITFGEKAVV